jgi:hypothetical protein
VPSHIPTLVRDDFLPCSAEKRKREEITENEDFNGEDGNAGGGDGNGNGGGDVDVAVTPVKKVSDESGASVVPTRGGSKPLNPIEFRLCVESRVPNRRRQTSSVCAVRWLFV